MEEARNKKVIGSSLAAKLTIYADGEIYDFIDGIKDELRTIFIVSGLELEKASFAPDTETVMNGEYVEGIKVQVGVAEGTKCERCWTYSETVGQNETHPQICARCADNI